MGDFFRMPVKIALSQRERVVVRENLTIELTFS